MKKIVYDSNNRNYSRQPYLLAVVTILALTLVYFVYTDWELYQYFKESNTLSLRVIYSVSIMTLLLLAWILIIRTTQKREIKLKLAEVALTEARMKIDESELFFKTICEQAADGISLVDLEGNITFVNQAYCDIIGYSEAELLKMKVQELEPDTEESIFKQTIENDHTFFKTLKIKCKNNELKYIDLSTKKINSLNQHLVLGILRDVTVRVENEKALRAALEKVRESEQQFKKIFISLQDSYLQTNSLGEIVLASPSTLSMFGYQTDEELLGHKTEELYSNTADRRKLLTELQDKGSIRNFVLKAQRKDRTTFWASINIQYHFDKDNQIVGTSGVIRDITDRVQAEDLLQKSRTLLRSILDSTNDLIWSVDVEEFRILEWNPSFQQYFNEKMGIDIHAGQGPADIFPEGSPFIEQWISYYQRAKTNGSFVAEQQASIKGEILLLSVNLLQSEGQTFGISVFAKDISDIRAKEVEVSRVRKRFQTMFEKAPLGISLNDLSNNKILEVNEMFTRITGHTKEELIEMGWLNFTHSDDIQQNLDQLAMMNAGEISGFQIEKRYIHFDKSIVWVNMTIASIQIDNKNEKRQYLCMIEDITERKMQEDKVRTLSNAVEQSPVSIIITNLEGNIEYVNPKFTQITGYSFEEAFNQNPRILKTGNTTPDEYKQLWENITSGKDWKGEFCNKKKNGEIYYESASIFPVFDEKGEILRFVAIKEDITERKLIEKTLLDNEEQFRSTFEQAAVGIAHIAFDGKFVKINQRLCDIVGYSHAEMLLKTFRDITHSDYLETDLSYIEKLWSNQIDSYNLEKQYIRKDGSPIWVNLTVSIKYKTTGEPDYVITVIEDISIRKQAEDELHKFTSHLQNVREEEKKSIAREIHDDLGQMLVAQKIDMGLLKKKIISENTLAISEDISTKLDNMVSLIDRTIKSARAIMNGLRPEILETHGFAYTTNNYLNEFEIRNHITCKFNCQVPDLELDSQQSLSLFRIVQEALNNIVKYAQATLVNINITNPDGKLHLEIIDNGVGFDINNSGRKDSYGMIGMRERVILIEGKLDIKSELGKGTSVIVEIPYYS